MAASTQALPGVYLWEPPEKTFAIRFHLDIVDKLLPEVMRAFAAVPKRGAEVGGVFIGSFEQPEPGGQTFIHIEDFELVPCEYARGPSYLLAGDDRAAFEHACRRWSASGPDAPAKQLVGYFRSHTRGGLELSAEDIELMDRLFPHPRHLAMLIRPFSAQPAEAAFFVRDNGAFPRQSPRPFLFSRLEMSSLPAPPPSLQAAPSLAPPPAVVETPPPPPGVSAKPPRASLHWLSLFVVSLAFLLLGAAAGYQAPRFLAVWTAARPPAPFSLALRVVPVGDNLAVRWDPQAPAIRGAQSGLLQIEDAGYSKPVDLDAAHLQSGGILYRNTSAAVRFKLTVYESARLSVTETVDWPH
ncbi:MAG TPA: hypothetical protein VKV74_04155 [Bryobacteraceae bacterium]|nr:hypothetical protein [Bryobacteraceae bacterium]